VAAKLGYHSALLISKLEDSPKEWERRPDWSPYKEKGDCLE
jgi:hypothetical protein